MNKVITVRDLSSDDLSKIAGLGQNRREYWTRALNGAKITALSADSKKLCEVYRQIGYMEKLDEPAAWRGQEYRLTESGKQYVSFMLL